MSHNTMVVLPQPNANFIWYCSWMSFFSAIFAYSQPETAHFAIVPASVLATSLNYWRNPLFNSWRRYTDMSVVLSGLIYQSYYTYTSEHVNFLTRLNYFYLIGLSALCYIMSCDFMKKGCVWPATYAHASIHFIANIANIVLYKSIYNQNHCHYHVTSMSGSLSCDLPL